MECVIAFATGFVAKIGELVVEPIGKQIGYLIHYDDNIKSLKEQHEKLEGKKRGIKGVVDEKTRDGLEISPNVQDWLGKVDRMTNDLQQFYENEVNRKQKCLGGWCPNLKSCYSFSKNAKSKAAGVVRLREEKVEIMSYRPPLPNLGSTFSEGFLSFPSRMSIVTEIMEKLEDDDQFQRIAICGMGGVGKTTMVKKIIKTVEAKNLFTNVAMAVVSQNPDYRKIQGEIADAIGFKLDSETERGRAIQLFGGLKKIEKVLIVLDDIWTELEFESIGLPSIEHHKGCKILLTSRNEDVCYKMRSQCNFTVSILSKGEAWDLFREMLAGGVIERVDLHDIAEEVADECGGLPIAIVTIGRALQYEEKPSWEDALNLLRKSSVTSFPEMQECVYSRINLSYKFLGNEEEAKCCLLLCCLFPEDFDIPIEDLLRHGVGLGLFQDVGTLYDARNHVHRVVSKLKKRFLLLESNKTECVKMHDVVRDVIIGIATEEHGFMVGWPKEDARVNSCAISLMLNEIKDCTHKLDCPNLKMLQVTSSKNWESIPENFFQGTRKLMVIGMQQLYIPSTSPLFQALSNLRTLRLENCFGIGDVSIIGNKLRILEILSFANSDIKQLPIEIGQLGLLRLLDLTGCEALYQIASNVFTRLLRLEELYFRVPYFPWEINSATLADLKSLLPQLKCFEIAMTNVEGLPKDLDSRNLLRFWVFAGKSSVSNYSIREGYLRPNTLMINTNYSCIKESKTIGQLIKKSRILKLVDVQHMRNLMYELNNKSFLDLQDLSIKSCEDLEYLVNASDCTACNAFPQLQRLSVKDCNAMECIISNKTKVEESTVGFSTLESLKLEQLPNLSGFTKDVVQNESRQLIPQDPCDKGIRRSPLMNGLLFPKLKKLSLFHCNQISSLFSASSSASLVNLQDLIIFECSNMEEIVCEEANVSKIVFPRSQHLSLYGLSNLRAFCCGSCDFDFSSLKEISIVRCNNMEVFSYGSSYAPKLEKAKLGIAEGIKNTGIQDLNYISQLNKQIVALEMYGMPRWSEQNLRQFIQDGVMDVCYVPNLLKLVPINEVHMFKCLKKLYVRYCDSLVEVFESEGVDVTKGVAMTHYELLELHLTSLQKLMHIWKSLGGVVSFQRLRILKVEHCDSLKSILSPSMAKNLVLLQHLYVGYCYLIEEIVTREEEDSEVGVAKGNIQFPQLNKLKLVSLSNLKCFCPGNFNLQFPFCREIIIEGCENIMSFCNGIVNTPKLSHMHVDSNEYKDAEDLNVILQQYWNIQRAADKLQRAAHKSESLTWMDQDYDLLEDLKKVRNLRIVGCEKLLNCVPSTMIHRFQHLENLTVRECKSLVEIFESEGANNMESNVTHYELQQLYLESLPKLVQIWNNHGGILSFQNLKVLRVYQCDGLKSVLSPSLVRSLFQLKTLRVTSCEMMEEIVRTEDVENCEGRNNEAKLTFPKLESLELDRLANLKCFISDNYDLELPSCETIWIEELSKMETFCYGTVSTPTFSLNISQFAHFENIMCTGEMLNNIIRCRHQGSITNMGDA